MSSTQSSMQPQSQSDRSSRSGQQGNAGQPSQPGKPSQLDQLSQSGQPSQSDQPHQAPRPLLSQHDYVFWFIGDTSVTIGNFIGAFAFTLLAYPISGSVGIAGLVGGLYSIAQAVTMIPGGLLSDKVNRRTLMYCCSLAGFTVLAALIAVYAAGLMTIPLLMAFAIIRGLVSGLLGNITNVVLPQIVSKNQLAQAMGSNQSRDAIIQILSTPVTGFLYGLAPEIPFLISALLFALLSLATKPIRADLRPGSEESDDSSPSGSPAKDNGGTEKTLATSAGTRSTGTNTADPNTATKKHNPLSEILVWFLHARAAAMVLLVSGFVNFGISLILTVVILDQQQLKTAPALIGLLDSASGIGMILGALGLGWISRKFTGGKIMILSIAWITLFMVPLAFTTNISMLAVLLFTSTLPLISVNSVLGAFSALLIPNRLRGRILATGGLIFAGVSSLANVLGGFMLQYWGYRVTLLVGSGFMLASLLVCLLSSDIRAIPMQNEFDSIQPIELP